ncbi:hemin receptor [Mesorhizobium sp. M1C.F.Ca.ET.193.01.1.1]|uniref:globin family protein n=1 Tax=unclassified Mesorhizobium TaxID=325217 RepID=UPI000FD28D8D|nr:MULTISPECIES: globin family protein [unclassified Mesorhizobium]TGS91980.1 hemin receptor [bacterium M00.F.Ca.ET.177.01.1.1]TGQ50050.1 hemin receptor [Mesorhizobium sp. M1C.F.Ca.ET.210.01.1.1]TGQ64744.1 hemin receptor [Mesorhizobium sp. M1C.F.Ca.ET.212.01.1.1]TGQ98360.1 hemin receptor [Mesorhizobium sp. M1C.F.Ca.ET.204.01.1.1]TGR18665.1 hemin receptor [Mesorhizobium sp. M1C.F.Ca.ET.196.01.1.1]
MTPDQIRLVQETFRQVLPIRVAAAALFYDRLFSIDSSLRPLFPARDMTGQGAKLMAALGFVVHGLERAETILPAVQDLARRHVGYGVEERHYPIVGQALIETLETGLGPAFTPEVREAWGAAYGLLAGVMIAAAREVELAA